MQSKHFLAAVLLAASPVLAWSADAPTQLRQFVAKVASATGEFTQQTLGQQGQAKPPQSGVFSFQRPGHFKWQVQKPYAQLIVSDGTKVLQYDPDLSQVTERTVDKAIGASPAAILFGSGSLDDAFIVSAQPDRDGLQWLRAVPRDTGAGFAYADIGFKNDMPARLELKDSFGQTTRIDLSHMVANPKLPAGEFTFVPPKGTDVVKM
ncbi:outer membrane lipoprotein chaperone LolA [Paralcaligenes ureilyticus]|uniref:Outer-membrane lipoprotein carrier protein n=1 Tax=Paralcaligenes ureilyticus TaxID=627131 RepID=A0A4R3LT99_9BURK|nr:outer membrane lipoprotein chaperone LolA [Paralcaligenes ureilyticus]TCT03762.1 outer membrane lipoprotein carrier protein [Paralcaligenes ureilyticus]